MFWGLSFIATKFALKELTPLAIINLRLIISIPLLGGIAYFTRAPFSLNSKQARIIFVMAAVSVVHLLIQVTGLKYTSAANTGWIIGTTPVFIAIMSRVFLKEQIGLKKIAGISVSIAGLLLLISRGHINSFSFISGTGDLLVLASCVTWGFFSVLNRKIAVSYPPVVGTFYLFVFMAVISLPFNLHLASVSVLQSLSINGWTAILFLGIFCSGLGYALWSKALSEMDSANAAAFLYLEPFVTLFGAWILLGENISAITIISGLIIMAGVWIVNFSDT